MRQSTRRAVFIMFAALLALSIHAADAAAETKVEAHVLKVEGLVIGKTLKVDQTYAQQYKRPVKAPFELIIPNIDGVQVFAAFPPKVGGEYFKISFATKNKELIENIRIIGMTIPLGSLEQRVATLKQLFVNQALPMALKDHVNPKILAGRMAKIHGLDAIEAIAQYDDLREGRIYVWLVGILNPDSPNCVLAMSQITSRAEAKTSEDIGKKGITVKSLSTFKFIK